MYSSDLQLLHNLINAEFVAWYLRSEDSFSDCDPYPYDDRKPDITDIRECLDRAFEKYKYSQSLTAKTV